MASYARTSSASTYKNQMSVLAQAKPAIISPLSSRNNNFETPSSPVLSEKLSNLRFSSSRQDVGTRFGCDQQRVKHIEDESVIQKQNASNQMRQAAVMAAVASQQKVRLSATERLALTAKKPILSQQPHSQQQQQQQQQVQKQSSNSSPPAPNPKPAPLPTLETLLAVQRQLQQHTKQHLAPTPQQLVSNKQRDIATEPPKTLQNLNKPLPPSPPKSPFALQKANLVIPDDTYDKDLPPLPPSISPSVSTDDSQMNSLDSHQSSPATSLVSIPPPPPPISSYLQQYDEVSGSSCHQSISSSPSTCSEVSLVKQSHALQIKSSSLSAPIDDCAKQNCSFELPQAYKNDAADENIGNGRPPPTKETQANFKPQHLSMQQHERTREQNIRCPVKPSRAEPYDSSAANQQQLDMQSTHSNKSQLNMHPWPHIATMMAQSHVQLNATHDSNPQSGSMSFNQHSYPPQTSNYNPIPFLPPPPPPLSLTSNNCTGFDEPDNFRFPTPPPPDLLLDDCEEFDNKHDNEDDEDDDDDFQCKIPTPPPHRAMSTASFPDVRHCHQMQIQEQQHQNKHKLQQQSSSPSFNSSTFTVPNPANGPQPPLPFRQQAYPAQAQPQLTVHINNESGLLSTGSPNLQSRLQSQQQQQQQQHATANHHHHIMMSLAASSSSPSSSSDGDGHSSNSSSSTSGIHSSIDSPSSSNSKLDDFNYGGAGSGAGSMSKPHQLSNLLNQHYHHQEVQHRSMTVNGLTSGGSMNSSCSVSSTGSIATICSSASRRPALKQKKSVSFSDKVELVACAEEQSENHLPNPLLARVLATKLQ